MELIAKPQCITRNSAYGSGVPAVIIRVKAAKEIAMLRITRNDANRLDLELDGKLDADAMRAGLDELISKSEGIEHGRMLYRIGEFDIPTFGALGVEFTRLPALFRMVRKFDRVALLADQSWVRKAGEIEGALFPGLEIKAFEAADDGAAEAWLAE